MSLRCQDLVLGSGPAGSITAGLLSEHGRDTIVLEEGPGEEAGSPEPFSLDEMVLRYRNRGLNPAIGSTKVPFVEACCLGGGSEINSGLYHRTPAEILESWRRDYQVRDASAEDMQPHCEAVEASVSVCTSPGPFPLASRKLLQGAQAMGWNTVQNPRWVSYENHRRNADGSPAGDRVGMSRTWIPRARKAGARIMTGARAVNLRRSGAGWVATAWQRGTSVEIQAEHVFLCCGAVQTPLLLRRIGIRRNVGNTLALHPTVKVVARFDEQVNYEAHEVPYHQVKEFAPEITFGGSISAPPHMAMAMTQHSADRPRILHEWKQSAVYYVAVQGPPSGSIRAFPLSGDAIIRYETGLDTRRKLATGLRDLCRLLFAAGARELFPTVPDWGVYRSMDDLRTIPEVLPQGASLMSIHLFCSCPMGELRDRCAVDSWGRVFDAPGLSVHDASIFCGAPSVNPQGSIMAFAHRNTMGYLESL